MNKQLTHLKNNFCCSYNPDHRFSNEGDIDALLNVGVDLAGGDFEFITNQSAYYYDYSNSSFNQILVSAGGSLNIDYVARYIGSNLTYGQQITNTTRIMWIDNYYDESTNTDLGGHGSLYSDAAAIIGTQISVHSIHGKVTINNLPADVDYSYIEVYAQEINGTYPSTSTMIDSNGNFSLAVFEGTYKVIVLGLFDDYDNKGGYSSASLRYNLSSNLIVAGNTELNIIVPSVMLSGMVTDTAGTPVPGTNIQSTSSSSRSTSGSDGSYRMLLLPDTYTVSATPPSNSGFVATSKTITVLGNTVENIVLDNACLIHGKVTINNLPADVDYSYIEVYAQEINGTYPSTSTMIDSNGNFSLAVFEGTYKVIVLGLFDDYDNKGGYSSASLRYNLSSNLIVAGDTELNIIVPLVMLSGMVTDTAGNPVPGTNIQSTSGSSRSTSGSDGSYRMLLLPDTYTVRVTPPSSIYPPFYLRDITIYSNLTRDIKFGFLDSDDDGYADSADAFPFNENEWLDTNGDGIGDNADLDDDADGMPDIWESLYAGLNTKINDAIGDIDGDGKTNYQEFLDGSDPINLTISDILLWEAINTLNWNDTSDLSLVGLEPDSLYAFVSNCLADTPEYNYVLEIYPPDKNYGPELCQWIHENYKKYPIPAGPDLYNDGRPIITPFLDDVWDNQISIVSSISTAKFNTVYKGMPYSDRRFEVISMIDDYPIPLMGTDNLESYLFTYDTRDDSNGIATDINEWIDHLKDVTQYYGRPIDTLTIVAHGTPGIIHMSGGFKLLEGEHGFKFMYDSNTMQAFAQLRGDGIIAPCDSVILLFACYVGQTEAGKEFVQKLADYSGATVYANTQATGKSKEGSTRDWTLDVMRRPSNYVSCPTTKQQPVRAIDEASFMFPGGLIVEIPAQSLTSNGTILVTDVTDNAKLELVNTENLYQAWNIIFNETSIAEQASITVNMPVVLGLNLADIDSSRISVKYWDIKSGLWSELGITNISVNTFLNTVTFQTSHTSTFGVFIDDPPAIGDINRDGIIDQSDVNLIKTFLNHPISECQDCDLDGDGRITILDARKIVTLCTCPRCVCP